MELFQRQKKHRCFEKLCDENSGILKTSILQKQYLCSIVHYSRNTDNQYTIYFSRLIEIGYSDKYVIFCSKTLHGANTSNCIFKDVIRFCMHITIESSV